MGANNWQAQQGLTPRTPGGQTAQPLTPTVGMTQYGAGPGGWKGGGAVPAPGQMLGGPVPTQAPAAQSAPRGMVGGFGGALANLLRRGGR